MRAGLRRERVRFQSSSDKPTDTGNIEKVWEDQCELWARVEMLGGQEDEEHQQQANEQRFRITLLYSPVSVSIDPTMRAAWSGRYINIGNVRANEQKTEVIIEGMQRKGSA